MVCLVDFVLARGAELLAVGFALCKVCCPSVRAVEIHSAALVAPDGATLHLMLGSLLQRHRSELRPIWVPERAKQSCWLGSQDALCEARPSLVSELGVHCCKCESVGRFVMSCRFSTPRTSAASGATLQTRDCHRSAGTFIWGFRDQGVTSVLLLSFLENRYFGLLLVVLQLIEFFWYFIFLLRGILIIMEPPENFFLSCMSTEHAPLEGLRHKTLCMRSSLSFWISVIS